MRRIGSGKSLPRLGARLPELSSYRSEEQSSSVIDQNTQTKGDHLKPPARDDPRFTALGGPGLRPQERNKNGQSKDCLRAGQRNVPGMSWREYLATASPLDLRCDPRGLTSPGPPVLPA
ncbi:hypothetical protein GJAV_G00195580 [Gymnothorax javanicus]|nr:hypothetical protein GJAV_G00195580 [Gymnothorax javanicus]